MSLDVYLIVKEPVARKGTGVFVREDGQTVELTTEQIMERWPEAQVIAEETGYVTDSVYSANITHNLGKMASEAGIYQALWRPEEIGVTTAAQLIPLLTEGLALLKSDQARFEAFNAPNGWGLYKHFVPFVEDYLNACREYPDAELGVSR